MSYLTQSTKKNVKLLQVEELRSQLRLLQAVGFGSVEGEDGHQVEHNGPG